MSESLRWKIPLILVLLVAGLLEVFGGYLPWADPKKERLKLGFDLKGGVELRYQVEGALTDRELKELTPAQIGAKRKEIRAHTEKIVEIVHRRLDPSGIKEVDIRSEGSGEIIIRLPGLTPEEVKSIKRRAEQMGRLEFRVVVTKEELDKMPAEEKKTVREMQMKQRKEKPDEPDRYQTLLIQTYDQYNITGELLQNVRPTLDDLGAPAVRFSFNTEGGRLFGQMTKPLAGKSRLAIILNGQPYSAPFVRTAITQGNGVIEGDFTEADVNDLVAVLQAGSLPATLRLQSETFVGPELGTDSRDRGYFAVKLSFVLVVAFMAGYYFLSGAIADLALGLNLLFLVAAMMITKAVMTLPGIAGVILTVGMAVDANVLIYERVREELAQGQTLRFAIKNGYSRAFTTIFDANLTTLLTALILYWQGTGSVRGFAVTLSIGIVVSMFTALFVTRTIFDLLISKGWLKERLTMLRFLTNVHIDFVRWAPVCIVASLVLITAGMVVFVYRGRDNYGIDFSSGVSMHLQLKGLVARPSEVTSAPDGSRFTVDFFDTSGGTGTPVEVSRYLVEDGLRRLKAKDETLDLEGIEVVFEKGVEPATKVEMRVPEKTGDGSARGKELARLIEQKGHGVFRLRKDIQDVRKMVADAGYPRADVQTAFGDANVVGMRESDQFTVRVRSEADNVTQEQREAVPTNIEQAFSDLVDHRSVDVEVFTAPAKADNDTSARGILVTLRFVQFDPTDNTTLPAGLRWVHIEHALAETGLADVKVRLPRVERKYFEEIALTTSETDQTKIAATLKKPGLFSFPEAFTGYYFVGPGQAATIIGKAWKAAALSMIAITIYIWLRFGALKYGLAAVLALVHDVLFTLGALASAAWLAETPLGQFLGIGDVRLSLPVIAGILTLIGYSLNDTIVVFDRVRENVRRRIRELRGKRSGGEALTPELIDQSVNQTLSRTTLTSFTTLVVCVTLYIAGGMTLHGLALCLTIGVVVGTYSSIFIASPILVLTHTVELRRARAKGELTTEEREVARERGEGGRR